MQLSSYQERSREHPIHSRTPGKSPVGSRGSQASPQSACTMRVQRRFPWSIRARRIFHGRDDGARDSPRKLSYFTWRDTYSGRRNVGGCGQTVRYESVSFRLLSAIWQGIKGRASYHALRLSGPDSHVDMIKFRVQERPLAADPSRCLRHFHRNTGPQRRGCGRRCSRPGRARCSAIETAAELQGLADKPDDSIHVTVPVASGSCAGCRRNQLASVGSGGDSHARRLRIRRGPGWKRPCSTSLSPRRPSMTCAGG